MLNAARLLVLATLAVSLVACGAADGDDPVASTAGPTAPVALVPGSTPAPAAAPTRALAAGPAFAFSAHPLSGAMRRLVRGSSWHPGCPVGLDALRHVRMGYWGFDGRAHRGEMVVHVSAVGAIRRAFAELFRRRFPIRRMHLVDHYGASDYTSIEADNTSAFNCRRATGQTRWSEHAYGRAVDVNPIENPYVYPDGSTVHRASRPYLDRSHRRKGMAVAAGALVRAFERAGWGWGGAWRPPNARDLQHFSATGR